MFPDDREDLEDGQPHLPTHQPNNSDNYQPSALEAIMYSVLEWAERGWLWRRILATIICVVLECGRHAYRNWTSIVLSTVVVVWAIGNRAGHGNKYMWVLIGLAALFQAPLIFYLSAALWHILRAEWIPFTSHDVEWVDEIRDELTKCFQFWSSVFLGLIVIGVLLMGLR